MKLEALDHPKTLDFAARLNVELPTAIGYLELLWAFTGKKSPQGNIGKWPNGAIARACFWNGNPETFVAALVDAGYLDANTQHRYMIHDWSEHAPRWVKAKLKNLKLDFIIVVATTVSTVVATTEPTVDPVCKGREVQGKGSTREGKSNNPSPEEEIPPGLNLTAWQRWQEYRISIRKPLKPASILAAQETLAAFGSDQQAVVQQSIADGYQGLFPLKNTGGGNATRQQVDNSAVGKVRRANDERERRAADSQRQADGAGVATDGGNVRSPLD